MATAMLIVAAVLSVFIFSWCIKMLYMIWWWPKIIGKDLKKQGIHGRPYKFLYGNLKEMMKMCEEARSKSMPLNHDIMPRVNPLYQELATTCKKIFLFWLGPIPRVIIMEPKLIHEVLLNKSGGFTKPKMSAFLKLFVTGLGTYDGEKWAKHRKIFNPAFHVEKLKRMFPAFSTCTNEMISRWEELVNMTGSHELDVSQELQNLAGDILSRAAFGGSFEEGRLIFSLQREQCELIFTAKLTINVFPWLRFIPTKINQRRWYIYRKVRSLLKGVIEKRDKDVKSRKITNNDEDLLGLLLKSNEDEVKESKNSATGMSIEDIIAECNTFYFAGQETSAAALIWTMIVLSMHTDWQERARQEVFQIVGKNELTFDDLSQLKIVTMIVQEVMRLYPSGSLVRATSKRMKLGEFSIPPGVQIEVPLQIIHRDTELWGEDALIFNPERFSDGVSKAAKAQIYFPFGWGPRTCIGMNFAMLELKMVVCKILQRFSFELSPSYAHAPNVTALLLRPQYGAQIILHSR